MIRQYEVRDTDTIIIAWYAASKIATPFLTEEFLAETRENIRNLWLPNAETWVFEAEGKVIGFITLIENEVGAIFVHPKFQGTGAGKALMDHAISLRGHVFLDVFEENSVGRRFYDGYGFQFESKHLHKETGHMHLRLVYTTNENTQPTMD